MAGASARWRRFSTTFSVAAVASLAVLAGGLVLLDPYDTGRLTPLEPTGMAEGPPWQVNASRARDPQFDSAIIGNSRAQMLEPAILDEATGSRFVNLSIQGAGPLELQRVFGVFLRHHPAPRAVIIGVDEWWCRPEQKRGDTFPYWLYAPGTVEYLRGLVRYQTLEHMPRRFAVLRGDAAMARPDGYWDYTSLYLGMTGAAAAQRRMRDGERRSQSDNPQNTFPAVAILKDMLDALPDSTRVAVVWPPTHTSYQPSPGSAAETTLRQCQAALRDVVTARPGARLVDWSGDRDFNRDAAGFHDETHYRKPLADRLSADVADGLAATAEAATH